MKYDYSMLRNPVILMAALRFCEKEKLLDKLLASVKTGGVYLNESECRECVDAIENFVGLNFLNLQVEEAAVTLVEQFDKEAATELRSSGLGKFKAKELC